MKVQLLIITCLLLAACGQSNEQTKKFSKDQTKAIPVGKGPDALFLTPDERYL